MISNANDYIQAKKREKRKEQANHHSVLAASVAGAYLLVLPPSTGIFIPTLLLPLPSTTYLMIQHLLMSLRPVQPLCLPPSASPPSQRQDGVWATELRGGLREKTNPECHTLCAQCGSANMIHTRRHLLPSLA